MRKRPAWRFLFETLVLTTLYVALGKVCTTLAQAMLSGNLSVFWLPAGLALAAFMLLGWRAGVGVWLGAMVTHAVLISGDIDLHAVISLAVMASGSTAQAALAAWFIGHFLGLGVFASPSSHQRMLSMTPLRLAAFTAVIFALATTLAPSIGTASLVLSGEAERSAAATLWKTWWLGDLAGMLGIGPVLFFMGLFWRKTSFGRDQTVLCLTFLLAGAGLLAFTVNQQYDQLGRREALDADLSELIALEDDMMGASLTQVIALKAFMEASGDVSLEEFKIFTTKLTVIDPLTRSLSWMPQVKASERSLFEKTINQSGRPEFFIQDGMADNKRMAAALRPDYFPVTYTTPPDTNGRITGLDVGLDPVRRAAFEEARDSGKTVASAPVALFRTQESMPGVLIVAPVYRQGLPLLTVEQRRLALTGVVGSVFSHVEHFAEIRRIFERKGIELFVFDQATSQNGVSFQLLASSLPATEKKAPPSLQPNPVQLRQGLYAERNFEFAGRERLMIVRPHPSAIGTPINWDGWLILVFSFVLSGTLLHFQGRREAHENLLLASDRARHEEAEFIKQLLEQLPIGVVMRTLQGDIIDANPAFFALLGRPREQALNLSNKQITPANFSAIDDAQLLTLQATGSYGPYEKEYQRPDGSRVPVQVRGRSVEFKGRTILLSVAEDIAERRKSEFQIAQSQKMDAIGQLTGGLAHNFNNMLGVVIGNLDLLASQLGDNSQAHAKLNNALKAALECTDLTRALLAVARTQVVHSEPVDLSHRLQEMLPLLKLTAGIAIDVTLTGDDHLVVEVDPGGLASAMLNLVINARDAMPDGGRLNLATKLRTIHADQAGNLLKPGHYAELSVTDTGNGMRPEILARALEPFFTTKERGRGTGLGLSMAHGFVKQCGGNLTIYSEPDNGTTLRLMLPIAAQPCGADAVNDTVADETTQAMPPCHERVLVVDDEIELLAVTATWLKALGYEVTPCTTPESALTALQDGVKTGRPYALMVTDVIMPGMNGFELARAARADHPALALLYISGFADVADRGRTRPDGAILEKPFRQPALATLARQALDTP